MIVAIMQPTYLPWAGYFDLIDQCDAFVLLDTAQFAKQSWQQRNRIKTSSGPLWLTVPCSRCLPQRITDVCIDKSSNWRRKHWMSIAANYSQAPYWHDYRGPLEAIYLQHWDRLIDLNLALITLLTNFLGIEARFLRTSEMFPSNQTRTARLVEICVRLGADDYLSPRGSFAYLESERPFANQGIRLAFHQFEPPVYPQLFRDFVPYLSVIDLVLNLGPAALDVIRSARRPWLTFHELAAREDEEMIPREVNATFDA